MVLDELVEAVDDDAFDPRRDAVVVLDLSGRAVAFGSATTSASRGTVVRVDLDTTVHPGRCREGIGHALPAWQEGCGLQYLGARESARPGRLVADAREEATPIIGLLRTHGYEPTRWWPERELTVRTATSNLSSRRCLERSGFNRTGFNVDRTPSGEHIELAHCQRRLK
ncbi:hypothetical protein ACF1A9_25505 [Streptomyces sp. NPDC014872]|uniref:hypothetical protein n=1 Tax=Streptomyces sp. NPDC014872 TaxID=3364926 RepID=UPI0036F9ECE5